MIWMFKFARDIPLIECRENTLFTSFILLLLLRILLFISPPRQIHKVPYSAQSLPYIGHKYRIFQEKSILLFGTE